MDFLPIASKPIFVAYLPPRLWEQANHLLDNLKGNMPDYHILVCCTPAEGPYFEAFYAKDLNITDFEEFQRHVLDQTQAALPVPDARINNDGVYNGFGIINPWE